MTRSWQEAPAWPMTPAAWTVFVADVEWARVKAPTLAEASASPLARRALDVRNLALTGRSHDEVQSALDHLVLYDLRMRARRLRDAAEAVATWEQRRSWAQEDAADRDHRTPRIKTPKLRARRLAA